MPSGWGLIVATRSVRGLVSGGALIVVAVDDTGRVLATRLLTRGRVFTVRAARWMIEVGKDHDVPPIGAALAVCVPLT